MESAGLNRDGPAEHRAVVDERVKLAVLAAGIDFGRQTLQQPRVEFTPCE